MPVLKDMLNVYCLRVVVFLCIVYAPGSVV
jgi:hypothetical protein